MASSTVAKPVRGKKKAGWFFRRHWPTVPDGFSLVIPAWWHVPGAGPAPTTAGPIRFRDGLPATPATVAEIAASGADPPSPLFRAAAQQGGDRRGVAVGVYDVGVDAGGGLEALCRAIREAVPGHVEVTEVAVSRLTALEVHWPPVESLDGGGALYTTDVWVEVPHRPGQVAVLRLWQVAPAWDDEAAALERVVADTFQFLLPGQFRGRLNRWALRRWGYFEPPDRSDLAAPAEDGGRAAGWRLGVVFHTAPLTDRTRPFFTRTERPTDELLGVAVLVAWIAVVYGFLADHTEGAGDWVYYGGSGPILAWGRGLRRGRRSILGLLATLGTTVGLGFALG